MPEQDQETYLKDASYKDIFNRGLKKLITEVTSMKTLFLAFICVACAFNWISDMWTIVGGLATLGVKELPSDIFTTLMNKFSDGENHHGKEGER
jgi:hypothetical protein